MLVYHGYTNTIIGPWWVGVQLTILAVTKQLNTSKNDRSVFRLLSIGYCKFDTFFNTKVIESFIRQQIHSVSVFVLLFAVRSTCIDFLNKVNEGIASVYCWAKRKEEEKKKKKERKKKKKEEKSQHHDILSRRNSSKFPL